jgi:nucleoside phosphorylase
MVRLLLVEDNKEKAAAIQEAILEVPGVSAGDIVVVDSIVDAKRAMLEVSFDVMVVDIHLPMRGGETPRIDGGITLLQEVTLSSRYHVPTHVIGLTAFEEAEQAASESFAQQTSVVIRYDRSSYNWRDAIKRRIEQLLSERKVAGTEFGYDFGLIAALDEPELSSLLTLPWNWVNQTFPGDTSIYHVAEVVVGNQRKRVAATSAPQMGMPAAALASAKLIQHFRPRNLVMGGIAAAVRGQAEFGDILVADASFDLGSGKLKKVGKKSILHPDPLPLRGTQGLLSLLKQHVDNDALHKIRSKWPGAKPSSVLSIRYGTIGSGAAVIADSAFTEDVQDHWRKLLGIDLETYGVYYAANHVIEPRPSVVAIKSVTDFADEEKDDKWREYAAFTSSRVIEILVCEGSP